MSSCRREDTNHTAAAPDTRHDRLALIVLSPFACLPLAVDASRTPFCPIPCTLRNVAMRYLERLSPNVFIR